MLTLIDFRATPGYLRAFATRRGSYIALLVLGLLAGALLAVALGAGLPLMGRVYNPDLKILTSLNGALHNNGEFLGIFLLMYLGTLAITLLGNFIPNIVVLDLPFWAFRLVIAFFFTLSLAGCALVMAYMLEPQLTFTPSVVVGRGDPLLWSAGGFYFVGFSYLAMLSGGVLIHLIPHLNVAGKALAALEGRHRVALFLALCLFLW